MSGTGDMVSYDFARLQLEEVEAAAAAFGKRHVLGYADLDDPALLPELLARRPNAEPLITLVWGSAVGERVLKAVARARPDVPTPCVLALNYRHWAGKIVAPPLASSSLELPRRAAELEPNDYTVTQLPWERRLARDVFEARLPAIGDQEYAYVSCPNGSVIELCEYLMFVE